jgi:hypothetical protein
MTGCHTDAPGASVWNFSLPDCESSLFAGRADWNNAGAFTGNRSLAPSRPASDQAGLVF